MKKAFKWTIAIALTLAVKFTLFACYSTWKLKQAMMKNPEYQTAVADYKAHPTGNLTDWYLFN
jgi:hypothetical protein